MSVNKAENWNVQRPDPQKYLLVAGKALPIPFMYGHIHKIYEQEKQRNNS